MKPRVIVGGPVVHGAARKPPVLSKGVGLTVFGVLILFAVFGIDAIAYPWAFAWMRPITGTPRS